MARGSASPFVIVLTEKEREELERRSRAYTDPYWRVTRAKIVLMAAQGLTNVEIAVRLDTSPQVVHRWRKRFFECRLAGLEDLPRSGRPRGLFPPRSTPRSKPWRASCPPPPACRCLAGVAAS